MTTDYLISPCGGSLIDLRVAESDLEQLRQHALELPSLQLSERALCDLEMLAAGAFSPLTGFMRRPDYERVLAEMRMADGTLFPVPVTLPVNHFNGLKLDSDIALRDSRNDLLAVMAIEDIYEWSKGDFAHMVLGTDDTRHPLRAELDHWGSVNIAGTIRVLALPRHYDFARYRLTPAETRVELSKRGYRNVVAFQTRNPMHR